MCTTHHIYVPTFIKSKHNHLEIKVQQTGTRITIPLGLSDTLRGFILALALQHDGGCIISTLMSTISKIFLLPSSSTRLSTFTPANQEGRVKKVQSLGK